MQVGEMLPPSPPAGWQLSGFSGRQRKTNKHTALSLVGGGGARAAGHGSHTPTTAPWWLPCVVWYWMLPPQIDEGRNRANASKSGWGGSEEVPPPQ
jgi:hypothetical protein